MYVQVQLTHYKAIYVNVHDVGFLSCPDAIFVLKSQIGTRKEMCIEQKFKVIIILLVIVNVLILHYARLSWLLIFILWGVKMYMFGLCEVR